MTNSQSAGDGRWQLLPDLESFDYIGHYEAGQFCLANEDARDWRGIYVWARDGGDKIIPLRVGLAWGKGGIAGRHRLHNRWLAGLFKPHDAREQAVRRFTMEGAGDGMVLLGYRTETKAEAREIEDRLRAQWGSQLILDLKAVGSWISQQMKIWRFSQA
jgi:hypothetical protein